MLLIECPYCGPRPEVEFRCGGEAHIARPATPSATSDEEWTAFLSLRTNTRGWHAERWRHAHGCQRWFNALRHTVSDRIAATYRIGAPRPDIAALGVADERAPGSAPGEGAGTTAAARERGR